MEYQMLLSNPRRRVSWRHASGRGFNHRLVEERWVSPMQLSARNQLKGVIKDITLGNIMAEIVVELPDGQEIVALITFTSSERLNLQIGDEVTTIFKSTEVMIAKDAPTG